MKSEINVVHSSLSVWGLISHNQISLFSSTGMSTRVKEVMRVMTKRDRSRGTNSRRRLWKPWKSANRQRGRRATNTTYQMPGKKQNRKRTRNKIYSVLLCLWYDILLSCNHCLLLMKYFVIWCNCYVVIFYMIMRYNRNFCCIYTLFNYHVPTCYG